MCKAPLTLSHASVSILVPSKVTSSNLNANDHIGKYYLLNQKLLPEVPLSLGSHALWAQRTAARSCTSLQDETSATRSNAIMNRECLHTLRECLIHERLNLVPPDPSFPSPSQSTTSSPANGLKRVLLKGPMGSGKSIALASLVETARSMGWIALYLPCAANLTKGGYFSKREEGGGYDTMLSAQEILQASKPNKFLY